MEFNYEIIRSRRKTIAIQITREGAVVVRAPMRANTQVIEKFVAAQNDWIMKHLEIQKARIARAQMLSEADVLKMQNDARSIIPQRVMEFARIMKLMPSSIKITSAKSRFGSCNARNGLCFSWRLMQYDMRAVDYVIVHELAHITHKNHGAEFYKLIAQYMPDYKERIKMLRK